MGGSPVSVEVLGLPADSTMGRLETLTRFLPPFLLWATTPGPHPLSRPSYSVGRGPDRPYSVLTPEKEGRKVSQDWSLPGLSSLLGTRPGSRKVEGL